MNITTKQRKDSTVVYFRPETEAEEKALDNLLGFKVYDNVPLGDDPAKKVFRKGSRITGEIGGHERDRWIITYAEPHKIE